MKPSVTVGISALNEEANIKNLLLSILKQKGDFSLDKVVVISDGSDDSTVNTAKSVEDGRVLVVDGKTREGKAIRQNEICKMSESDTLVIMDADTLPADEYFISKLIKPIILDKSVGLVSGPNIPVTPKNIFEKVLVFGLSFKTELFESIGSDNVFLCVGANRAFSKEFYKKINWPAGYPEDAYSYLSAISFGYKFKYQKDAKVLFRLPDNLTDHLRQSRRFIDSPIKLEKYFSKDFISKKYKIPKAFLLTKMFKYFFKNPFYAICYLFVASYPRVFKRSKSVKDKWDIAVSTKKLIN